MLLDQEKQRACFEQKFEGLIETHQKQMEKMELESSFLKEENAELKKQIEQMADTFSQEYKHKADSENKLSKNYGQKLNFLESNVKIKETQIESLKLKTESLSKRNQDLELEIHLTKTELGKKIQENDQVSEELEGLEEKFRSVISKQQLRIQELEKSNKQLSHRLEEMCTTLNALQ